MINGGEVPNVSRWQQLHDRGVILKDHEIDFITSHVVKGSNEALNYLGQPHNQLPRIIFSDDLDTIGYAPKLEVINIPVQYLNKIAKIEDPLPGHQQMIYTIDGLKVSIPYSDYLRRVGREETIHHFQKIGHPYLNANFSDVSPADLSQIDRLLCDIEVEARKTVDTISIQLGEQTIWEQLDRYLAEKYPDRYNKPADYLLRQT